MKKHMHIIMLFFALSFWGPITGIKIASIYLFPARLLLPLAWAALLFLILNKDTRSATLTTLKANPWVYIAPLWFAYALISFTWVADTSLALQHTLHLFLGLSILVLVPLVPAKALHNLWSATAVVIIGVGFVQLLQALKNPIYLHYQNWLTWIFGNENNFALFITLSLPILFTTNPEHKILRTILRPSAFTAIPIGILLILMTTARLSYVALGALVIFLPVILLLHPNNRSKVRFTREVIVFTLIILTIAGAFAITPLDATAPIKHQFASIPLAIKAIADPQAELDLSTNIRMRIILDGIIFAQNSSYLGIGPGNFEYHMNHFAIHQQTPPQNPHNWWIELLAEYGICIFLLYCATFIFILHKTLRTYLKQGTPASAATLASLVIFPVLATAPSRLIWYLPHWLLLAFAVAASRNTQK